MLNTTPVAMLVGTILGFLTGLGVGGGSLLMLWLTAVLGMDPHTARCINLMFFLPGAGIALCFRQRQGILSWKRILPAALAGCAAAWLCSQLSTAVDNRIFQQILGGLFLAAGIKELLWKPSP